MRYPRAGSHRLNPQESGPAVKVFGVVMAALLVLPLVIVLGLALNSSRYLQFPPRGISLDAVRAVASSDEWRSAFTQSITVALLSAPLSTLLGLAAALGLRRVRRGRRFWQTLIILPLIVPLISTALALYPVFSDLRLLGTTTGLVLAHAMIALPFTYLSVSSSLSLVDPQVERAAASLGANWWALHRRVVLPLIAPGLLSALAIAVAVSFDEVIVALYVSSPTTRTVPVLLWASLRDSLGTETAAAALLVVGVNILILLIVGLLGRLSARRRPATGRTPS